MLKTSRFQLFRSVHGVKMWKKVWVVFWGLVVVFGGCDANSNVMKIFEGDHRHPKALVGYSAEKAPKNNMDEDYISYDLGILLQAVMKLNHTQCGEDAITILEAIAKRERWAIQMFDSSSKFPVGLLSGDLYQMGNFDECIAAKQLSDPESVQGQYCLAEIKFKNANAGRIARSYQEKSRHTFDNTFFWGICVPSSCKIEEIETVVEEIFMLATVLKNVDVHVAPNRCHVETFQPWTVLEIVYGVVIGLFGVFTILATVFHYYVLQQKKSDSESQGQSTLKEAILCFSVIRTVGKFLATTSSGLNLNCICGIKFLSMLFVIAGHTFLFLIGGPVKNTAFYERESRNFLNAIFTNNPLLVDTFLLIGGFLLCYLLFLELDKKRGKVNVLLLYIARYIRLTPSYLVVIGFYCTFFFRLGSGPLWDSKVKTEQKRCMESWWTNLLYVNNYVNTDQMCMFQSWYLAADYHLFIIASVLIVVLWKWHKIGKTVLGAAIIVSVVAPFVITLQENLDPTLIVFAPEMYDVSENFYFKTAYIKTHMRAGSYFIGVLLGYILYKLQTKGTKIPKVVLWFGWIFSTVCGVISLFSVVVFYDPHYEYNPFKAAIYAALHRVAWSLSIGWIIIVCVTKNARFVNSFLCWKPFIPLSRLTYCAYLINGVIEVYSVASLQDGVYMSKFEMTNKSLSHIVLTLSLGFVLCIFFESPIHGLEKIMLTKDAARRSRKNLNGNNDTTDTNL